MFSPRNRRRRSRVVQNPLNHGLPGALTVCGQEFTAILSNCLTYLRMCEVQLNTMNFMGFVAVRDLDR